MRSLREHGIAAAQIAMTASCMIACYFLIVDAGEYLREFTAEVYGRFWPVRNLMFVHIATGGLALVAGAVQLCLAFLRRTSSVHRWTGRVYIGAVLVSCVASLMVLRSGSVVGPVWTALLVTLAIYTLLFTACGLIAASRRQWQSHAAWMLRSYMAMMVFAWFRLAWEFPVLEEMSRSARAALLLGLSMLFAFVATELALRLRRSPR